MKSLPRLAALSLALALPLFPTPLRADDASHRAASEQLVKVMRVEQLMASQMEQAKAQMSTAFGNMAQQGGVTPDKMAAMQKGQAEMMTFLQQKLSWDAIRPDVVQAYKDTFTEAELKELAAFYGQPIGQKFLDKQPTLNAKVTQVMQKRVMDMMPEMMSKMGGAK